MSLSTPAFPELRMSVVHGLCLGVTLVSPTNTQHPGKAPCLHVFCILPGPGIAPNPEVALNKHPIKFLQSLFDFSVEEGELWVPSVLNTRPLCGPSASKAHGELLWP